MIYILVTVPILFIFYIILPSIFKIFLRKRFLYKTRNTDYVYLTFDDGPNPNSTPAILKLLNEYKAKATFFITWKNAEKNPEIITTIIEMGHELGDHGYKHLHPWKSDPFKSFFDFLHSMKTITSLTPNHKLYYYRPPYGKFNLVTLLCYLLNGKKMIFWDIDPKDYNCQSADSVADYVIQKLEPGRVILLHDGRGNSNYKNMNVTINALELILKASQKNGLKLNSLKNFM